MDRVNDMGIPEILCRLQVKMWIRKSLFWLLAANSFEWDVSLDVPLRYGFSLTSYYAHAGGESLMANTYPGGTNAQFGYVETSFRY